MISVGTFPGLSDQLLSMAWASKVSLSGGEGNFGTCCLMWSVWNGGIHVSFVGVFSCFTQKNECFPILLKKQTKPKPDTQTPENLC